MMAATNNNTSRLRWLIRRLSRISPAEVPYRVHGVLRAAAQGRGWFDAARVPPAMADAAYGAPWVALPSERCGQAEVLAAADALIAHGVPVFDTVVPLNDGSPDWNRDPKTGTAIPLSFGLDIDFRHLGEVDIKYLWELNRHVWWVPLAQAWQWSGHPRYLELLGRLLDSWLAACPYARGANWSSPVEHGIRLINWSIVWHLVGGAESPLFAGAAGQQRLARWLDSIYQHIRFASDNYSFHSSSDNHLIGEAAGVVVGAVTWDRWRPVRALAERAERILEEEMVKQFAADGVNLEQALCYHKFSLEFLLAARLSVAAGGRRFSAAFDQRLHAALLFMAAMLDRHGRVAPIGDADDGKVFRLLGDGARTPYEAMLAAGARLLQAPLLDAKLAALDSAATPARSSLLVPAAVPVDSPAQWPQWFAEGGYLVTDHGAAADAPLRLIMDIGPLGYNRIAGHGHADALALLLAAEGEDFLIDPGTYCYNAAPALRHYFRGTSAHNTVQIDGSDQSVYGGSFLWLRDIASRMHTYQDDGVQLDLEASHDGYLRLDDPLRHVRALQLDRSAGTLAVTDRFECQAAHQAALHWHFAAHCRIERDGEAWLVHGRAVSLRVEIDAPGCSITLVQGQEMPPLGWSSPRFYEREASPVLRVAGPVDATTRLRSRFTLIKH
ncbi:heparinase [Duganella sp. FT135W]|uniref:Heparinase n=1 Tax=Duganella flavida TaxID=2692175 RepID=A0A6L8KJF6_9BURK|nr:alginate lyase family protein [Duganella flavida]MYM25902.1 heparinase [Duganella flavida]